MRIDLRFAMATSTEEILRRVDMSSEHAQGAFASHEYEDAMNAFDMARSMLDEGLSRKDYCAYA